MRSWCVPVLVATVWGCGAALSSAEEINKSFHESFEVKEGDSLRLKHGDGDVEVIAWEQDLLDVAVRYHVDVTRVGVGGERDFDVEFSQVGRTIYVTGKEQEGVSIGFHSSHTREYRYTIKAPAYLELGLEGDDGDVRVAGWRGSITSQLDDGDVELDDVRADKVRVHVEDGAITIRGLEGELDLATDDGDVVLEDCRGAHLRIQTEDGDLSVRDCEGALEIRADDGDIRLEKIRTRHLDVRNQDGELELELLKSDGLNVELQSGDGDVAVRLEPGLSAMFSIDCEKRRTRVELPDVEKLEQTERRTSGELAGGRGRIRIRTDDGRVTLKELR